MPALPEGEGGAAVRQGIIDGIVPLRRAAARRRATSAGHALLLRARCGASPSRRSEMLAERYGRGRRHLGGDVVDTTCAPTRSRSSAGTGCIPERSPGSRHRHRGAGRRARPGGGHHRLHARRARPGGALRRPALRLARHRRLRPLGRPGRAARVLRGRRGAPRGGRPATALARRTRASLRSSPTPSPSSASTPNERRPSACEHGHEGGHRLLGSLGHPERQRSLPSTDVERDSRRTGNTASRAAPTPPPSRARTPTAPGQGASTSARLRP